MKVVSFNVNSVRMRLHQLAALIDSHQPDFIGLQETKVSDAEFPRAELEALGYQVVFYGQKTHYGVAILSRHPLESVQYGFPGEDPEAQRRFIAIRTRLPDGSPLTVLNGYFPQGENRSHALKFPNKARFYADLNRYLDEHCNLNEPLLVIGDMNISPTDLDIGIGEDNRKRWLSAGKCSFLPEEREWLRCLMERGLSDSFRSLHPQVSDCFSWFDYRSKGFEREPRRGLRIDLILANTALLPHLRAAGVDYAVRAMDKPSDHAPVWAEFSLG